MPGQTADGATMRSVAWRLLSATTAGSEGSSMVGLCRAPSEAEGFEADRHSLLLPLIRHI